MVVYATARVDLRGEPGRGIAGRHAYGKNTGSMGGSYLLLLGLDQAGSVGRHARYAGYRQGSLAKSVEASSNPVRTMGGYAMRGQGTRPGDLPHQSWRVAPATCTYFKARHIGGPFFIEAQQMSGSIQSSDYVPGVSGWKLNSLIGELEINSCAFGSASAAPERQMVSVEVASWSKYYLPKNAANLLQFMQAELQRVPEEYRHAAEFEEFDASHGDESFNARLFLSYSRLETEEELVDRLEKAKNSGTRVNIKNGLMTVTHDGAVRYKIGNLDQPAPEA